MWSPPALQGSWNGDSRRELDLHPLAELSIGNYWPLHVSWCSNTLTKSPPSIKLRSEVCRIDGWIDLKQPRNFEGKHFLFYFSFFPFLFFLPSVILVFFFGFLYRSYFLFTLCLHFHYFLSLFFFFFYSLNFFSSTSCWFNNKLNSTCNNLSRKALYVNYICLKLCWFPYVLLFPWSFVIDGGFLRPLSIWNCVLSFVLHSIFVF